MISLPRLETNAAEVERSTDSELHHRNQLQHGSWILGDPKRSYLNFQDFAKPFPRRLSKHWFLNL